MAAGLVGAALQGPADPLNAAPDAGAPAPKVDARPAIPPMPQFMVSIDQDASETKNDIEKAAAFEAKALALLAAGKTAEARDAFAEAVDILQEKVLPHVTQPQNRHFVVYRPLMADGLEHLPRDQQNLLRLKRDAAIALRSKYNVRFIPALRAVREMIAGWPAFGREVYRNRYEVEAGAALDKAVATNRPEAVRAVADLYGNTNAGRRAMELAGDMAADSGSFQQAVQDYREMLDTPEIPDADMDRLTAKIATCAAAAGRPDFLPAVLRQKALAPDGRRLLKFAGRDVPLADFVGPLLAQASKGAAAGQADSASRGWVTFGGTPAHDRVEPSLAMPLASHWNVPSVTIGALPSETLVPEGIRDRWRRIGDSPAVLHNPHLPAFYGDLMLLHAEGTRDGDKIGYSLKLFDLEARRQRDELVLPQEPVEEANLAFPGVNISARIPGSDRFMSLVDNRVYLLTGRPALFQPQRWRGALPRERGSTVALRAVDIVPEVDAGRKTWRLKSADDWRPRGRNEDEEAFLTSGWFLTAPVPGPGGLGPKLPAPPAPPGSTAAPAASGREALLYAGFTRNKGENWLVAMRASDGMIAWRTKIAQGSTYMTANQPNPQVEGSPPAVAGGSVYYCTNMGAMAAVDAETGDIRWISVYEPPRLVAAQSTTAGDVLFPWRNCPPIVHGGRVFAAPLDGTDLVVTDALTGEGHRAGTKLNVFKHLRPRYLLGVAPCLDRRTGELVPAIFVVGRKVVAMDALRLRLLWIADLGDPNNTDRDPVVGRPTLTEDTLLVPTRGGIVGFDLRKKLEHYDDGKIEITDGNVADVESADNRRQLEVSVDLPGDFPLRGEFAGNLTVHRGRLIVAVDGRNGQGLGEALRSGAVYVAKSQSLLLEELSRRETGDPLRLGRLLSEGRARLKEGRFDLAAGPLAAAAEIFTKDPAAARGARTAELLSEQLLALADKLPAEAGRLCGLSGRLARDGPVKASALWRAAGLLSEAGKHAEAVHRLQEIIAMVGQADWAAGRVVRLEEGWEADILAAARDRILRILEREGTAFYDVYEKEAADKLRKDLRLGANVDPMSFAQIYRSYPASVAGRAALMELGRRRSADEITWAGAIEAFRAVRRDWPGTQDAFMAAEKELVLLEKSGAWGEARDLLRSLAGFRSQKFLGSTVAQVIEERSARPQYASLRGAGAEPDTSGPVKSISAMPVWSRPAARSRLLAPSNSGAAADPGIAGAAAGPEGSAVGPVLLLGPEGIEALDPRDGTQRWVTPLPHANGGTDHSAHPRGRIEARRVDDRLLIGLPGAFAAVEAKTGKLLFSEAAGLGRAFRSTDKEPPPAGMTSARMLRAWGDCDGTAFGTEAAATQVFSAEGDTPRLRVFRMRAEQKADWRVATIAESDRLMGPPIIAGDVVVGLTRTRRLKAYGLWDGRADRPELATADPPLEALPLADSEAGFLLASTSAGLTCWSLRAPVYGPDQRINVRWVRNLAGGPHEPLATAGGIAAVLGADGTARGVDLRTGDVRWTVADVRPKAGGLVDVIAVDGGRQTAMVFGGCRERPAPDAAAGWEVVVLQTRTGRVTGRATLKPDAACGSASAAVWLSPQVVGDQMILSAVLPRNPDHKEPPAPAPAAAPGAEGKDAAKPDPGAGAQPAGNPVAAAPPTTGPRLMVWVVAAGGTGKDGEPVAPLPVGRSFGLDDAWGEGPAAGPQPDRLADNLVSVVSISGTPAAGAGADGARSGSRTLLLIADGRNVSAWPLLRE